MTGEQGRGTRVVLAREAEPGVGERAIGLGTAERRRIGAVVDRKQDVALPDDGAVLEVDRLEKTSDSRANLDGIDGVEARRELVPLGDLANERLDHLQLR